MLYILVIGYTCRQLIGVQSVLYSFTGKLAYFTCYSRFKQWESYNAMYRVQSMRRQMLLVQLLLRSSTATTNLKGPAMKVEVKRVLSKLVLPTSPH